MLSKFKNAALAAVLSALPAVVLAAPVDVDDVVADIAAQIAPVTAIGGGVLLLLVAIKAFKWVRRAM